MRTNPKEIFTILKERHDSSIAGGSLIVLITIFLLFAVFNMTGVEWVGPVQDFLLFDIGLVYPVGVAITASLMIFLLVSPWGRIRFGKRDSEPEFSNFTYFSMLFSVSLAAGIAFFAPGEAVNYLTAGNIPPGTPAGAGPWEIGERGIGFTLIHWGFFTNFVHYILVPPFAYYCYRRGAPFRISTALYPVVSDRPTLAKLIDILGVSIIILGLASSVSEVTANFLAGISFQWTIADPMIGTILFLLAVTLVFTTSTVTGLFRGISRLSVMSVIGLAVLTGGVFLLGPTRSIIDLGLGATLGQVDQYSSLIAEINSDWVAFWTIFNWAIWLTGATGIGLFCARISYGRTLREFLAYSCIATAVANMIWFYVIGGAVVDTHLSGAADILGAIEQQGFEVAGYPMFLSLPAGELFLFLFLGIGLLFLITQADSVLLSIAMTASSDTASPPRINRWFWGVVIGITTIILTLIGGVDGANMLAILSGLAALFLSIVSLLLFVYVLYDNDDVPDLK